MADEDALERRDPVTGQVLRPGANGLRRFQAGHMVSTRSGFYTSPGLRPEDRAEVEELAAMIAETLADFRASFSIQVWQLALKLWRQARAYAYLADRGLVREDGSAQPLLVDLAKLENGIARDLDALGLNPRSLAALGLDVALAERSLGDLAAMGSEIRARRQEVDGG